MSTPLQVAKRTTVIQTANVKNQRKITRTCSCTACDSLCCFEKRYNCGNVCNCTECTSNSCLFCPKSKDFNQKRENTLKKLENKCSEIEITKHNSNNDILWNKFSALKNEPLNKNYIVSKKDNYEKNIVSLLANNDPKECGTSAAELTAQVMNVPLQDLKHSDLFPVTRKENVMISDSNKKEYQQDIFSRLKEIYKACSCKICECIAGKSLLPRNNLCKCEPCDCTNCPSFILRKSPSLVFHGNCTYWMCDKDINRNGLKTIERNTVCNCIPCDCVKCIDSTSKPCNCEPCNCMICNFSVLRGLTGETIIMTPINEHMQLDKDIGRNHLPKSVEMFNNFTHSKSRNCSTNAAYQCETYADKDNKNITHKHSNRNICEFDVHNALVENNEIGFESLNDKNITPNCVQNFVTRSETDGKENKINKDITKLLPINYHDFQNLRPSHDSLKNVSCECHLYNEDNNISKRTNKFSSLASETSTCNNNDLYNISYYLNKTSPSIFMKSVQLSSTQIDNKDYICNTLIQLQKRKISNFMKANTKTNNQESEYIKFTNVIGDRIDDNKHSIQHLITEHNVSATDFRKSVSLTKDLIQKIGELKTRPELDRMMHKNKYDVTNSRTNTRIDKLVENIQNMEKINETIKQSYLQEHSFLSNDILITKERLINSKKSVNQTLKNCESISNINDDNQRFNNTIQTLRKILDDAKEYTNYLVKTLQNSVKANEDFVSVTQETKCLDNLYFYGATCTNITVGNKKCKNNKFLEISNDANSNVNLNVPKKIKLDSDVTKNKRSFYKNKAEHIQDFIMKNKKADLKYKNENEPTHEINEDHLVCSAHDVKVMTYDMFKNNRAKIHDSKNVSDLMLCYDIKDKIKEIKRKCKTNDHIVLNVDDQITNLKYDASPNSAAKLYYKSSPPDLDCDCSDFCDLERDIVSIKTTPGPADVRKCEDLTSCRGNLVSVFAERKSHNKFSHESSQTFRKPLLVDKEINCNRVFSTIKLRCIMEAYIENIITCVVFKSERSKKRHKIADVGCVEPRANILKNLLENLKARFTNVRRISEHTVIVKWDLPRGLDKVLGYELQVNGRTFEKIMVPNKRMAVVTSLPKTDKILLSIQTITSALLPFNRRPTNTVVYYPHKK